MAWKGLVPYKSTTGSTEITDWAGQTHTVANSTLLEGSITGHIQGSQLTTNWAMGTLADYPNGITSNLETNHMGYKVMLDSSNSIKVGYLSGFDLSSGASQPETNAGSILGKFSTLVSRTISTADATNPDTNKFKGLMAGLQATSAADSVMGQDVYSFDSARDYTTNYQGWANNLLKDENGNPDDSQLLGFTWNKVYDDVVGTDVITYTARENAFSIMSTNTKVGWTGTDAGTFVPGIAWHAATDDKWGPLIHPTTGATNHNHNERYVSTSDSTQYEQLHYNTTQSTTALSVNTIEGNVYVGPNQYVGSFTDTSGDTWFMYNLFRQWQGGGVPGGAGSGYTHPLNGVEDNDNFQAGGGAYYYQLGGSPEGTTTLGASTAQYELLIDNIEGRYEAPASTNTTMTMPFPGGCRVPCHDATSISRLRDLWQEVYDDEGIRHKALGVAYSVTTSSGTTVSTTNNSSLDGRGPMGTYWVNIDETATAGTHVSVNTKYQYPWFVHTGLNKDTNNYAALQEATNPTRTFYYFHGSDAGNARACDGAGITSDGTSTTGMFDNQGGFLLPNTEDANQDMIFSGRFFGVKVAKNGGGNTVDNTFNASHNNAARLHFAFTNLHRVKPQNMGSFYQGYWASSLLESTTSGSLLRINGDMQVDYTTSFYEEADLSFFGTHINTIEGITSIGDTDGRLMIAQAGGLDNYFISIKNETGTEDAKVYAPIDGWDHQPYNPGASTPAVPSTGGFALTGATHDDTSVVPVTQAEAEHDPYNYGTANIATFEMVGTINGAMSVGGGCGYSAFFENINGNNPYEGSPHSQDGLGTNNDLTRNLSEFPTVAYTSVPASLFGFVLNHNIDAYVQAVDTTGIIGDIGDEAVTAIVGYSGVIINSADVLYRPTASTLQTFAPDNLKGGGHITLFKGSCIDKEFYENGNKTTESQKKGTDGVDDKIFIYMPDPA
tara:strand:+ start:13049 stop:15895 length:2847 start_codon:yes stop_codon:yes gene_type:complete